jgi:DNA-binding response OmpR family regulator
MQESIPEILRLSGYEVVVAKEGSSALRSMETKIPELVICDADMPEPGPLVFLHELRKKAGLLPVIVYGDLPGKEDVRKVMTAGADDCLPIPFETIDLLRSVEACLSRKQRLCHRVQRLADDSFDPGALLQVYGERDVVAFKRKQLLYVEGQRALCVWLVIAGRVKTYRINDEGKELITPVFTARGS